jgi:hypothetical protein
MTTNPIQPMRRLLDRAQKRFVRSRPGSVLILVVALLVMMALIGTAYMTMAQFDRGTAIVHSFNTEVDLLLDGVINQVKGTVTNDVFSSGQFRPAAIVQTSTKQPVTYNTPANNAAPRYWNGIGLDTGAAALVDPTGKVQPGDWWLASRVPGLPNETAAPAAGNLPWWPYLSGPISGGAAFDQPYWPPVSAGSPTPQPTPLTQRTQVFPTFTQNASGKSLFIDGQLWPAFTTATGGISNAGNIPWMAADADGDGIADSGLVKLLTLDGVTYYAAVRIVDNSAAVNASIAEMPNPATTFVAGATLPGDLSPVNIDLAGMIVPNSAGVADDLNGTTPGGPGLLSHFRWNGQTAPNVTAIAEPPPTPPGPTQPPYARTDFQFPTDGGFFFNAQWFQLGRRLRNPGFIVPGTRYQSLPISEDLTMARGFVIRNASVPSAAASPSILERLMPSTLFPATLTSPYTPDNVGKWFTDSFYYYNEYGTGKTNYLPKRPLIVGQNPVSNFAPGRFNLNTGYALSMYQFGDVFTDLAGWKYVCICPNPTARPLPLDQTWKDLNWAWEPWTNAPTKTSANTATFQQLYAAYWAVMADQYVPPTYDPSTGAVTAAGQWMPPFPAVGRPPSNTRMFRNPIRDFAIDGTAPTPAKPLLSKQQTMQLRAAIAGVNTMALRHGDLGTLNTNGTNDVISRTIHLSGTSGMDLWATVYGVERQPYITQVFARNDVKATDDWIAVELYNPYPVPIKLDKWVLATVNRSNFQTGLTLTALGGGDLQTAAPGLTSIGAYERVVLMSSLTPPSTIQTDATAPSNSRFIACSTLTQAFGKELILMRPRKADAATSGYIAGSADNNQFTQEATSGIGLDNLVPIDSYDLTNMATTAATAADAQEWWYRRPNGDVTDSTSTKQWHFVYPGPWNLPSRTGGNAPPPGQAQPPTWSGTLVITPVPAKTDLSSSGGAGAGGTSGGALGSPVLNLTTAKYGSVPWQNYHDMPLQMNNVDFGGGNKPNGATNNSLPLGVFQRDGDLLQVTFIGSYKIWAGGPSDSGQRVLELNPVTADAAMATANDTTLNGTNTQEPMVSNSGAGTQTVAENVGRFCPIDPIDAAAAGEGGGVDDFNLDATKWRYRWATRLFDFLSIQSPQDDYLPNVDPWMADPGYGYNYRYTPANSGALVNANVPVPVANMVAGSANSGLIPPTPVLPASQRSEDTVPIDGLVNVNTAPWRVLAAIPWIPASYPDFRMRNAQIALALATYRDVNDGSSGKPHGPFKSLFELGEAKITLPAATSGWPAVPGTPIQLRDILTLEPATTAPPIVNHAPANAMAFTQQDGNLAPITTPTAAAVKGDFQAQFNTRSDSYTAYVLIQGWRNAETATPHLVVQRRAAVIIDRSNVTPSNRSPNAVNVPMN